MMLLHTPGRRATWSTTVERRAQSFIGLQHRGWHLNYRHTQRVASLPGKDPFAERTVYNDGPVDRVFIKLFSQKMADQLQGVAVPPEATYDDFVRISKEIMRGRNPEQQREVVKNVLRSLLPEEAPPAFRKLFPPTQFAAEFNARIAAMGFFWLVGESELREGEVEVAPGRVRRQHSIVYIKKCRYLEASGCVGLCSNLCKIPTQRFFTEDFGLPLTMNPNFEDLSCEMIFGQAPPPLEQDPVHQQPCFVPQCSLATTVEPCPKTDVRQARVGALPTASAQ